MKKQFLLILSFAMFSLGAAAQGIMGSWQFDDIIADPEMNEQGIAFAKTILDGQKLSFNANGRYISNNGKKSEEGSYTYDPSDFDLSMTDAKGNTENGTAEVMPDGRLFFKVGDLKMVMKKLEGASAMAAATPVSKPAASTPGQAKMNTEGLSSHFDVVGTTQNPKYVAVVPESSNINKPYLYKKWYFESRSDDKQSPDLQQRMNALLRGSYFDFTDNNYNSKLLAMPESGSWKLDQNTGTITLNCTEGQKQWRIQRLTPDELVLTRLNTHEVWTFKSKL